MTDTKVRISKELYDKLKEVADRSNKSIRELVETAITKFLLGTESVGSDAEVKNVKVVKSWRLRFPARCPICGEEIKAGSIVVREIVELEDGRKVNNFYHPDCYESSSDSALAKLYVRKRVLERTIRGLKKEADRYVELIETLRTEYDMLSIKKEVYTLWKDYKNFILHGKDDEKFDEFMDRLNDLLDKVTRLEASLELLTSDKKDKVLLGEKSRTGAKKLVHHR
ncbi:MAG: hypothetical protein DRH17_13655 [Deltaproteobacteria bacterium]|nr:MAG: hypothetical protein DRH17_13655 [Deltaproteobacteria bacterium]